MTGGLISNAVTNFRKTGQDKRTPAVIQKRIELISGYWEKCQTTHVKLLQRSTDEQRKTMSYFKNNEFSIVEDRFLAALDYMQAELESKTTTES